MGDNCPIVDTWWQTETGSILITPLPGITSTKPGAAMSAFPGIAADIVDNDGKSVGNGEGGYMVISQPWPSMLRGIWRDPERYKETYWSRFPGLYFAGDGAKKDEDGDFWLLGRIDDVMNTSPATASRQPKSSTRSSVTRRLPRQPSLGPTTRSPGRRSLPSSR